MRAGVGALLLTFAAAPAPASRGQQPITVGLDHIPVVVRDLEEASAGYRALGFALKPGRAHANGIRNAHVKLPDGAGIELLTASRAVDPLTARYVDFLRDAEGPASFSLHARDTRLLHEALRAGGCDFREDGEVTLLRAPDLDFLFLVRDNRSTTDRPEHFAHKNGVVGLSAVWVAAENGESLGRLLVRLGARLERRDVLAPDRVEATVAALDEGEIVILPGSRLLLPGRPVIGVTFRVDDLATARQALARGGINPWAGADAAERIVVPPNETHGLWLELREERTDARYRERLAEGERTYRDTVEVR
jgi:hypothetical protein